MPTKILGSEHNHRGITVKELKKALETVPDDTPVAIGSVVVQAVGLTDGVIETGYYHPEFIPTEGKHKTKALTFSRLVETSDGQVDQQRI
jgi:hypothetical protein